jgi:hypothetical protein
VSSSTDSFLSYFERIIIVIGHVTWAWLPTMGYLGLTTPAQRGLHHPYRSRKRILVNRCPLVEGSPLQLSTNLSDDLAIGIKLSGL